MDNVTMVNWGGPKKPAPTMDLLTCPLCPATFSNHAVLASHMWNAHGGDNVSEDGLQTISVNGYELSIWPWEDPQTVIDETAAVLEEMEAKPGLWFDEPSDYDPSLDFDMLLDEVRATGCLCPVWSVDPLMEDIQNSRFELAFVTGNSWI